MSAAPERGARPPSARPHVVVLGGGAAGISAARRLAEGGSDVTLLEASGALGGCIRTIPFAGTRVDVGAEALHTASPEPLALVADLGLTDELVESASAPTWIATPGGLRALPAGVGPAGPTRIRPLITSRLLSPTGFLRAGLETLLPRTDVAQDATVGEVLTRRFGRQVVDRIIDPLLGGLHGGDVDRLALDAATPQLAGLLAAHRSVVLAARQRRGERQHGFVTLRGGLGRLFDAAAEQLVVDLRTGVVARAVVDTGAGAGRYRVETDLGDLSADGVVVAVPARAAADVVAPLDVAAGALLRTVPFASVAVTVLAYPASVAALPALRGTGVLVPSTAGRLLKAATFLSTKWPHLDTPHVLVRASAGRAHDRRAAQLDDITLVSRLRQDLAEVAGLTAAPLDQLVVRWHDAMPQLEAGHRRRVAAARGHLGAHPMVALAGASYDGVGVGAAMRSGAAAADHVLDQVNQLIGASR